MKRLIARIGFWLCRHGWHKNIPYSSWDVGMKYEYTWLECEVCTRCSLIKVVGMKQHIVSTNNT